MLIHLFRELKEEKINSPTKDKLTDAVVRSKHTCNKHTQLLENPPSVLAPWIKRNSTVLCIFSLDLGKPGTPYKCILMGNPQISEAILSRTVGLPVNLTPKSVFVSLTSS